MALALAGPSRYHYSATGRAYSFGEGEMAQDYRDPSKRSYPVDIFVRGYYN